MDMDKKGQDKAFSENLEIFNKIQEQFLKENPDTGQFSCRPDVKKPEEIKNYLRSKKDEDNYEIWSSVKKVLLSNFKILTYSMSISIFLYIFYLFLPRYIKSNYWVIDELYFIKIENIIYNIIIFFIGIVIGNFFNKHLD